MFLSKVVRAELKFRSLCLRIAILLTINFFFFHSFLKAQLPDVALRDSVFNKYTNMRVMKGISSPYYVISYNEKKFTNQKDLKILRRISSSIAIVEIEDT